MKDILNVSRLILLVQNKLVENKYSYLLYAVGMFSLGLIAYILIFSVEKFHANYHSIIDGIVVQYAYSTEWEFVQAFIYFGGLFIFGGIFACISFVNFSNNAEAIFYLNKPASHLEKWLTEIIVHIFFFFLLYSCIYYLLDIPATLIVNAMEHSDHLENLKEVGGTDYNQKQFFTSDLFCFQKKIFDKPIILIFLVSVYITVVGFFMYGAVLFNKFSFFKTLFLVFLIGIVYLFYGMFFLNNNFILPDKWRYSFPNRAYGYGNGPWREVEIDSSYMFLIAYFLIVFVPAVLLACSYFKLKEKEV
jgi:hypothetical protein